MVYGFVEDRLRLCGRRLMRDIKGDKLRGKRTNYDENRLRNGPVRKEKCKK
jgi:hypothetical protein